MMNRIRWGGIFLASVMTGCQTTAPHNKTVFNPNAPSMNTIFHGSMDGPSRSRAIVSNNPTPGNMVLRGYTRDASNEVNNLFPIAPNPQLVMFVFPHLTPQGAPVPGFSTPVKLYEKDYYLLPGELQ